MHWKKKVRDFLKEKPDGKTAILVNLKSSTGAVYDFIKALDSQSQERPLMVFFNIQVPHEFRKLNLPVKSSEDYLTYEEYRGIDDYVFNELSRSWYGYKGITDYDGMALGRIFEYDFQKYLIPRIKNLTVIGNLVKSESIKRLIVIEDTSELFAPARAYAGSRNMPILGASFNKGIFLRLKIMVRTAAENFLSNCLDRIAFSKIKSDSAGRKAVILDSKLSESLGNCDKGLYFLPCLLEKGIKARFNLFKKKIPYLSFDFTKNASIGEARKLYYKKWQGLKGDAIFRNFFKYKETDLWSVVYPKLSDFFTSYIPAALGNFAILDSLSKKTPLGVVALRNDVKATEKTIVLSLGRKNIASLVMQHGILAEANGHNILLADKFAAWGKASLDWYAGFGNSIKKFTITGNPRFDKLSSWKPDFSRKNLCDKLNLDENKKIVLFVTQQINKFSSFWSDDLFLVMAEKILDSLKDISYAQLIIKADPYEDIAPYKILTNEKHGTGVICLKYFDIYTLIYFCDLVITLDSTAALEAMIMDKPVITLNITKRKDRVPYADKAAAVGVYNSEDIEAAVEKIFSDNAIQERLRFGRKKFLEDYTYRLDNESTGRVRNLLESLVLPKK